MNVFILSAFPGPPIAEGNFAAQWLKESAQADPFGKHVLAENAEDADLILFTEAHPETDPYFLSILGHPLYRKYSKKCFLYHDADRALPIIRGVYPSILKKDYRDDRCRSFGYIARVAPNPFIRHAPRSDGNFKWLYSFAGENNCQVRANIFSRPHPDGLVRDTTGRRHWAMPPGAERDEFMRTYAEILEASAFVLCPRGIGPATYRLYETMEIGRVPVILSDEWVPPPGPAWEKFALILPEKQGAHVDAIIREHAHKREEMGKLARSAWEDYFSKPVCFHRVVELCAQLMATPVKLFSQSMAVSKLLKTDQLRIQLRSLIKR
jgi:hypothetical protein